MNSKEVRKWLIDAEMSQNEIAELANVSKTLVSLVIKGERRSERVTRVFAELGCPKEFFEDSVPDGTIPPDIVAPGCPGHVDRAFNITTG